MLTEDELRVNKLRVLIKTYEEMIDIYIETAEKLNSMHQPHEAKPYIEQTRTLLMVNNNLRDLL